MPVLSPSKDDFGFGPFRLLVRERRLLKGDEAVELGARGLDVLVVLASRPNEVVSKKDLLAQAWPDVHVDEASLRFQIMAVRRALGDGADGGRYIATVPGRGYCFVAATSRPGDPVDSVPLREREPSFANLPGRLGRMVGRADVVHALQARLLAVRFVTIVGAGGVGKTTVAVAVGHELFETFAGAVLFVDLGVLSDPKLAAAAVASMFGLTVHSDDPTPGLLAFLKHKRMLLILDTCEHLIEAVATLAARIFETAPQVHILATSREALRVEGEHVYRLESLACPPEDPGLTALATRTFSAAQLFVERAEASGAVFRYDDQEAALIGGICRKLDGVALAIELAASRIEAHGLQQTAALLDQRLPFLWPGPRTAPARQKTLQATLDWSYGLLSKSEGAVLRRLAVFVGLFTLDAAIAVAASDSIDPAQVIEAVDSLVAKSMVAARPLGAMMRYRLLDTTRDYALAIRGEEEERADACRRHAIYCRQWLQQSASDQSGGSTAPERAPRFAALNNARAALEWSFGADGQLPLGVELAASAAPAFLALSCLTECRTYCERALAALDPAELGGAAELQLRAAWGVSVMFTRGGVEAARSALNRSLAIAEAHSDIPAQARLLGALAMFHLRTGEFNVCLSYARRCSACASSAGESVVLEVAHVMLGVSLHLNGELEAARNELEAAVQPRVGAQGTTTSILGVEGRLLAGSILARTLWLLGYPTLAIERAEETVREAAALDHSLTLAVATIWAVSVFVWTGELDRAADHVDRLIASADTYSLGPYRSVGVAFRGELAVLRGDARQGVELLESALAELHAAPYELLSTSFTLALTRGFLKLGRLSDAAGLIERRIADTDARGDRYYLPELLRVRARLLSTSAEPQLQAAEMCLAQALELSRRQGSRGWELRAAIDLAELWLANGRARQACDLLEPLVGSFVDGYGTADLKGALRLLQHLQGGDCA